MATLPQRTTNDTAAAHVADHNSLHDFFNTPLGSGFNIVTSEGNWTATQRFIGTAGNIILGVQTAADTNARARFTGDGKLQFGSGSATPDVELSRSAANILELATGDSINIVNGDIGLSRSTLGVFLDGRTAPAFGAHIISISQAAGNIVALLRAAASQTGDILSVQNSAAVIQSRFDKSGYFMTRRVVAPADGDLVASECSIWFTNTNGAGAINFKGKTANGTVVSGSVALA